MSGEEEDYGGCEEHCQQEDNILEEGDEDYEDLGEGEEENYSSSQEFEDVDPEYEDDGEYNDEDLKEGQGADGYDGPDFNEEIPALEDILPENLLSQATAGIQEIINGISDKFEDEEFNEETNKEATTRMKPEKPVKWNEYTWKRLTDMDNGPGRMYEQIDPNNIVQGALGSCYFMCSLSAIAERPAFVKRLIDSDQINENGAHVVWLNLNGLWRQVIVDDYFPVRSDGKFALGSAREPDRWVNFLEKAYAKVFGSYQVISGGWEIEALRDLTGAPYETFQNDDMRNVNAIWQKVKESDHKGYFMVCSIANEQGAVAETKKSNGLYGGHAYSLIACAEVKGSDGKQYRIVKIRNPWGSHHEWTGTFSDKSPLWTEEAKQQVDHKTETDGTWWMTVEDFCANFIRVGICKAHANFYYNALEIRPQDEGKTNQEFVLIDVHTAGKYYFSVDQEDKRFLKEENPNMQYDTVRITIAKVGEDSFRHVGTGYGRRRNVSVKCKINPGRYVAIIDYVNDSKVIDRPLVVTSYGIDIADLTSVELSVDQKKQIEHLTWRDYAKRDSPDWQNAKVQNNKISQGGNTVELIQQFIDKSKQFGLNLVRFKVKETDHTVSSTLEVEGGTVIPLGAFDTEVEIKKYGEQVKGKLKVKILNDGDEAESLGVIEELLNHEMPDVQCQVPVESNPKVKKRA